MRLYPLLIVCTNGPGLRTWAETTTTSGLLQAGIAKSSGVRTSKRAAGAALAKLSVRGPTPTAATTPGPSASTAKGMATSPTGARLRRARRRAAGSRGRGAATAPHQTSTPRRHPAGGRRRRSSTWRASWTGFWSTGRQDQQGLHSLVVCGTGREGGHGKE